MKNLNAKKTIDFSIKIFAPSKLSQLGDPFEKLNAAEGPELFCSVPKSNLHKQSKAPSVRLP